MSALELTARLAAWLVASGFVLLLAYALFRPLRSGRPALDGVIYLLLAVFLTSLFVLLAGFFGLLRPAPLAAIAVAGLVVLLAAPGSRAALRRIPQELKPVLRAGGQLGFVSPPGCGCSPRGPQAERRPLRLSDQALPLRRTRSPTT
jgi:hypothetical protein